MITSAASGRVASDIDTVVYYQACNTSPLFPPVVTDSSFVEALATVSTVSSATPDKDGDTCVIPYEHLFDPYHASPSVETNDVQKIHYTGAEVHN